MGTSKSNLSEANKSKLVDIISQMESNGESEDNILFVVNDFKEKHSEKKNPVGSDLNNGTSSTSQSKSIFDVVSDVNSLNNIQGNLDGTAKAPTLYPQPTKKTAEQSIKLQQEAENVFMPVDLFDATVVIQSNGSTISINPKTIPITPYANQKDYIKQVQERLNTGTITPQDQKFLDSNRRLNNNFDGVDNEELLSLVQKYNPQIITNSNTLVPPAIYNLLPETEGKTFGQLLETTDGRLIASKLLRDKIYSDHNDRYSNSEVVPDLDPKSKDEIEKLQQFDKKLAYEKTKNDAYPIYVESVQSTDESGNLWERFINRALLGNPTTSGIGQANLSAEVINRTKALPVEFSIGLNGLKYTEPSQHTRVTRMLESGEPLSESMVAQITAQGLEAKEAMAKDAFVNEELTKDQYLNQVKTIKKARYENIVDNKETLRAFLANGVANLADDFNVATEGVDANNKITAKIFGHKWNYTDAEIEQYAQSYAQANGIDPTDARVRSAIQYLKDNEGAMIMQNSIAKSGFARDFAKGLAQPIRGITASIEDIGKTNTEVYNEGQSQGNTNVSEKKLKRVENNWEGTVGDVLEGTGQFVTQAGLAYLGSSVLGATGSAILGRAGVTALEGDIALADIGGKDLIGKTLLKSKDALSTFVTSYAQAYDGNLKQALTYTADDTKAVVTANILAGMEGATELWLSPLEIARGVGRNLINKGAASKGILNILSDAAIIDKNSAVKEFLKGTLKSGIEVSKVISTEIGEEIVTQIADYASNAVLNPKSATFQNRNLMNEVGQTAYQTGLSMAIPALVSGVSAFNANNFSKGSLLIAAQNRQSLIDDMNKRVFDGTMTQDEFNEKSLIINTASTANETLPLKADGVKLNSTEKADYVFSRVSEAILDKRLTDSKDEAEKNILNEKIKSQQDFRTQLLKTTPNETATTINQRDETTQDTETQTQKNQNAKILATEGIQNTSAQEPTILADDATLDIVRNNADKIKIGTYKNLAKNADAQTATDILKEVADQWYDPNSRAAAERNFTKEVTNAAIKLFPNQEADNQIAFEKAVSVEPIIDRVSANQPVNRQELKDAEDVLYEALDSNPNAAPLIEPLILKLQNHENITNTETRTVTEREPIEGSFAAKSRIEIKPALEQSTGAAASILRANGTSAIGTINVVDGNYVIQSENGVPLIIGEKAITDRDLKLPDEQRDPDPIKFDEVGNVTSVTFETRTGDLVTITDPDRALDLAIQLQAQAMGNIPDEAFEKAYEQVKKQIKIETTISNDQTGSRPTAIKVVEPIQENVGESKTQGSEKTIPESTTTTGQGEPTTSPSVLKEANDVFEQDGETWTHLTNSKELIDKILSGEDFVGKGEKLENFVRGVKNIRFNVSKENGASPYFQKGKFYGEPTQKYLIVAKGDEKFTPNINLQNAESFEKSKGVGVLNPEFRKADNFQIYERTEEGGYKKIFPKNETKATEVSNPTEGKSPATEKVDSASGETKSGEGNPPSPPINNDSQSENEDSFKKSDIEKEIQNLGNTGRDTEYESILHRKSNYAVVETGEIAEGDALDLAIMQKDSQQFISKFKNKYEGNYLKELLKVLKSINNNRVTNQENVLSVGIALENEIGGIRDGFISNDYNIESSELARINSAVQNINKKIARTGSSILNVSKLLYNWYGMSSPYSSELLSEGQRKESDNIKDTLENDAEIEKAADDFEQSKPEPEIKETPEQKPKATKKVKTNLTQDAINKELDQLKNDIDNLTC